MDTKVTNHSGLGSSYNDLSETPKRFEFYRKGDDLWRVLKGGLSF